MKEILDITKEKMGKCVNALESELATIRAGRANPSVLDRITVDYYGCPTPVNQMASISVSEARILVVQPFDASTLKSIEKAIQASDLGINPTNDGRVLRIAFPQLTEDRRYDTELREDGRNDIFAYEIAFCRKRCKVVVKNL